MPAGTYLRWSPFVTERTVACGVNGTPTVFVGAASVPVNASMIDPAVVAAVS